jgi:hypothetical protein
MPDIGALQMNNAAELFRVARICFYSCAGILFLALLVDGKFLLQGIVGIFTARLPETATESDRRQVRLNRMKWLAAFPYFMLISLRRMGQEHLVIAQEKGLKLGFGYRFMVVWHLFWLFIMAAGYLVLYTGVGALLYGLAFRLAAK